MRLDWPDNLPPAGNLAPACPLLGERKQVREVVNTNKSVSAGGAINLFRQRGDANAMDEVVWHKFLVVFGFFLKLCGWTA